VTCSSSSSRRSSCDRRVDLPIYVYAQKWNLIGTRTVLIILYIVINLPLAIWMNALVLRRGSRELIEAAEIDGTNLFNQLRSVIIPIAGRYRSDALLCVISLERVLLHHPIELRRCVDDAAVGDGNVSTRGTSSRSCRRLRSLRACPSFCRLGRAEAHDPRPLMGALK